MRNAQHCAHPIFIWLSVILLIHDNTIAAVFAASQTDQASTLTAHNTVRASHQAPALVWDATAAFAAQNWAAQCALDRQYPSGFGQNIYVTNNAPPSIDAAVAAWKGQEVFYNYNAPQFTEPTEDFTQLVWVSSSGVGCAYSSTCSPGTPWISVLWCFYSPAGNVLNAFPANVFPVGSCSSRPNEVVGPDGVTCVCTPSTRRNAQGYCCVPFAVYVNGQCTCPAGLTFNGIGCCVDNSFWSGTVQDGNCVCNPGFFWNGQACASAPSCPPFAIFDGAQCVCPSTRYWTGVACCPFDSVWVPAINNCQCSSGFYWTGEACCPFDALYVNGACQCRSLFYWTGQACCPVDAVYVNGACQCRNFFYWTGQACCPVDAVFIQGTGCICNNGFYWTGQACCPLNAVWTGSGCLCNSGFFWNGSECQAA